MGVRPWMRDPSRIAAVLRELPEAIVVLDASATILWANHAAVALSGYTSEELVGRNGLDLVDEGDAETAATALLRTMASGGAKQPWPLRIVGKDGGSRWVEMAPNNLLEVPGVEAVLVSIRSLEGRYAAEAEAREIEELFRRAFDDAPIGMALVSTDGRFTRVNDALCGLLERPMLEVLGKEVRWLTHPDDRARERALLAALLAGEQRAVRLEKRFLVRDGSARRATVNISLVRTPDGEPERFVLHVQDQAPPGR